MGSVSEARTIGLSICGRISKAGLLFIRKNDPALYADIQKQLAKTKRPRKKRGFTVT